jgi:uroporphyrinogen decarboxylase
VRLHEIVKRSEMLAVAPLLGYPGARLTGTTVRQNLTDAVVHTSTIRRLWDDYRPDVVFPMMDLAVEAGALGLRVRFADYESPTVVEHPVAGETDLERFTSVDILADWRLQTFLETIRNLNSAVDALHAAYVVGPFTLAGLLMGASQIACATVLQPDFVHKLVAMTTEVVRTYAEACQSAGAEAIAFLEPTAVMLSPKAFITFSGEPIAEIVRDLHARAILHICGDSRHLVSSMCATGVDGLSLDSRVDLPAIAAAVGSEIVLIGNIDPVAVMGSSDPQRVVDAVRDLRRKMVPYPNFVLSTGCDLPFETPLANVAAFMREGRR